MNLHRSSILVLCLAFLMLPSLSGAQTLPLINATTSGGTTNYSVPVQTLLVLTSLSFAPAALMLLTSFTRILIVFSLLRQALGLQTMPPNIVLIGLSLFMTLFIMGPVFQQIYDQAYAPYVAGTLGFLDAVDKGIEPLKTFMLSQTRVADINLFAQAYSQPVGEPEQVPMTVLMPAFAISEIKTAFLIGFMIYLPFIAIDFAVASILTSLGMVMVSPMMFSLPLKLIIFVAADGWNLLSGSLINSFL
jgi:flagellar biosynthetic protein FliP